MPQPVDQLCQADATVVKFKQSKIRDELTVQTVGQELSAVADHLSSRKLVLNCNNVRTVSSAMLGKLFALKKRLAESDARLILCNVRKELRQILAITGLSDFFDIQENQTSALLALT